MPVTIRGNGKTVKTVSLVASGYTIEYRASSYCLAVLTVEADGSDGVAVNECAQGDGPVSGTTSYHATGPTTFRVSNTQGNWSLTFTPLA